MLNQCLSYNCIVDDKKMFELKDMSKYVHNAKRKRTYFGVVYLSINVQFNVIILVTVYSNKSYRFRIIQPTVYMKKRKMLNINHP